MTVAVPSAADSDAAIVKFAAWNDGPVRRTSGGFTVTPGGIEVGVTRMLDCGGHDGRAIEAETSSEGPVRQRETPDGLIDGAKSGTPTFTVKVVCALTLGRVLDQDVYGSRARGHARGGGDGEGDRLGRGQHRHGDGRWCDREPRREVGERHGRRTL